MKMKSVDKIYNKNYEAVKIIGNQLGFFVTSYNPDWIIKTIEGSIRVPNWIMGRVALLLDYDWINVFDNEKELERLIDKKTKIKFLIKENENLSLDIKKIFNSNLIEEAEKINEKINKLEKEIEIVNKIKNGKYTIRSEYCKCAEGNKKDKEY